MMKKLRVDRGPVGSWQNPRHVPMPPPAVRFERFGRAVLAILDDSPEWNAATLDRIATVAQHHGLVSEAATPVFASVLKQKETP